MPSLTDMVPVRRPQPWTKFHDYAVIDCVGNFAICPEVFGLRHIGYSNVFDHRLARDLYDGFDPTIRTRSRYG